jgi:hypothetical protein
MPCQVSGADERDKGIVHASKINSILTNSMTNIITRI